MIFPLETTGSLTGEVGVNTRGADQERSSGRLRSEKEDTNPGVLPGTTGGTLLRGFGPGAFSISARRAKTTVQSGSVVTSRAQTTGSQNERHLYFRDHERRNAREARISWVETPRAIARSATVSRVARMAPEGVSRNDDIPVSSFPP